MGVRFGFVLAFRCYLVSGAFETVRVGFDSSGVSLSCGGTGCSGSALIRVVLLRFGRM